MQFAFKTILALAFIVLPVQANQHDIEVDTFYILIDQKHYRQAFKVARNAIENGNMDAELHHFVAKFYSDGKFDVKRDEQKSAFFYEKAIQLGNYRAAEEYGLALTNGISFPQDCQAGTAYLLLAHENDVIGASALLGSNYLSGHCVPQNFALGSEYLERPLKQEYPTALSSMGRAHFFGRGTKVNLQKAFEFFSRAANQGECDGESAVGAMYDNGIYVDVDLEKAFEIFEKSHLEGCTPSTVDLAHMYFLGRHVSVNYEKAFSLYELASRSGNMESLSLMATMLIDGKGVDEDPKRGFELLHRAAERNDEESQYHLGNYYFDGKHVEQSYLKAVSYFEASLINPFSQFGLGYLYEFGLGVEQNLQQAEAYYLGANRQGNSLSIEALASWYIHGKHYAKDHQSALILLKQGNVTNNDRNVAQYAMLLACSFDSEIRNPSKALRLITEQKKLRENDHNYEIDLAEAAVLGALGEFESAKVIIEDIEDFYLSKEYTQLHIRHWYAQERFLSIKNDIESFQRCSW